LFSIKSFSNLKRLVSPDILKARLSNLISTLWKNGENKRWTVYCTNDQTSLKAAVFTMRVKKERMPYEFYNPIVYVCENKMEIRDNVFIIEPLPEKSSLILRITFTGESSNGIKKLKKLFSSTAPLLCDGDYEIVDIVSCYLFNPENISKGVIALPEVLSNPFYDAIRISKDIK